MDRFEREARECGHEIVAGIDEAGRGPLAGPVVAAAVVFPAGYLHPGIRDSKCLRPRDRETLYAQIFRDAIAIGIGAVDACAIDRMNILRATLSAMAEAIRGLGVPPHFLLVDGRDRIPVDIPQKTIVGGDDRSVSIAAASIIAKVSRDRIMDMYDRQFPQYAFRQNKGYATARHREAIRMHGPCKIHRRSFRWQGAGPAQVNVPLFAETAPDDPDAPKGRAEGRRS